MNYLKTTTVDVLTVPTFTRATARRMNARSTAVANSGGRIARIVDRIGVDRPNLKQKLTGGGHHAAISSPSRTAIRSTCRKIIVSKSGGSICRRSARVGIRRGHRRPNHEANRGHSSSNNSSSQNGNHNDNNQ